MDEPARYEKSYALQPRGTRNNTLSESQRVAAPEPIQAKASLANDTEALKAALLDGVTASSDPTKMVQDAFQSFQKATTQLLRAKGSHFITLTDHGKTVHDSCVFLSPPLTGAN